jgi:hypothetical protein
VPLPQLPVVADVTNDYKKDGGKPDVLAAVKVFYPALLELARMMEHMATKHRLRGAVDPFAEWKQLPDAKRRLHGGYGRHTLAGPLTPNQEDAVGSYVPLHGYQALFNLLGFLTIHQEDNRETCCAAPDAAPKDDMAHIVERARLELALQGEHQASPIHGPAVADWREANPGDRCKCGHKRSNHSALFGCVADRHGSRGTSEAQDYGFQGTCTCQEFRRK